MGCGYTASAPPRAGSESPLYPYPIPDELWQRLEPLSEFKGKSALPYYQKRSMVGAIFHTWREGRLWKKTLPGYPPGKMVYWHYRNWVGQGVWAEVEMFLSAQYVEIFSKQARV